MRDRAVPFHELIDKIDIKPLKLQLLEALMEAFPNKVSMNDLIHNVVDRPGAPLYANHRNTLIVTVYYLNQILKTVGWRIVGVGPKRHYFYKLERTDIYDDWNN